jgi:uncharacterized protein (DUF305 family)
MFRFVRNRRAMVAGAIAGIALVLAGCGSGDNSDDAGSMANMDQGASAPAAKSWNDADVQFAQTMIPDHQMVAQMAAMAEQKATSPDLQAVAKEMAAGQNDTVQMLTGMLTQWGKPTSGDMSGMQMPGAMTDKDMSMLESMKKGVEFDMMFAQMMVEHHKASIQMAKDEQANGANAEAKKMAADMVTQLDLQVSALQKIADMS